ncbi:putative sugar transporter [Burkholderia pseudomallei]|nr:putative sugar transporter [Burkholderia pseudomallei]
MHQKYRTIRNRSDGNLRLSIILRLPDRINSFYCRTCHLYILNGNVGRSRHLQNLSTK